MMTLVTITGASSLLDEVRELWGKNRSCLGPYPKGAFEDRAKAKQIIAAVIDGRLAGYLLYFTNRTNRRAQITHLCVADAYRSRGVAKGLVKELIQRTRHLTGIALHCRRDFPAHNLWPKLGFTAHSTIPGRTGQSELTRFYLRHSHPGLFDDDDDERVDVVMDANVFYDLDTTDGLSAEESKGLEADWLTPLIRLCYTEELLNDINRSSDQSLRARNRKRCGRYEYLESPGDQHSQFEKEIHEILGAANTEQDLADRRHLARAIAVGATVFVTRDNGLLSISEKIYEHHGLEVLRPAELISRFGEMQNEQAFQRDRLRGTIVTTKRMGAEVDDLLDHFHDTQSERKAALSQLVRVALADPINMEVHVVERQNDPLALYVVDRRTPQVISVPVFRVSRSIPSSRFRNSLTKTLVTEITAHAPPSSVITFTDTVSNPTLDPLDEFDFLPDGPGKSKVKIAGMLQPAEVAAKLRALAVQGVRSKALGELARLVEQPEFLADEVSVLTAEHALWPLKILGSAVACFIVPIQPRWATHLFDSRLANDTFDGADTRLAFNSEFVYYRSVLPSVLNAPARILWYVSEGVVGAKQIRATSRMTEVIVGPKAEVFKANRNLGVYEWKDVRNASKGVDVMALRCSDTQLFQAPVSWTAIQPVLAAEGIKNNLVAPSRISEAGFAQIYRMAFPEQ